MDILDFHEYLQLSFVCISRELVLKHSYPSDCVNTLCNILFYTLCHCTCFGSKSPRFIQNISSRPYDNGPGLIRGYHRTCAFCLLYILGGCKADRGGVGHCSIVCLPLSRLNSVNESVPPGLNYFAKKTGHVREKIIKNIKSEWNALRFVQRQ